MQTLYLLLSSVCLTFTLFCSVFLSLSLFLTVHTLWFCVTHQNTHRTLRHMLMRAHTHCNQLLNPGWPGVMNVWLIRQYFTVIHQVSEGHFGCSTQPDPSLSLLPSLSLTHTHTHTCTHTHIQTKGVTHSSKMTAQSGRKRRCVRPAPCIPIKMSELWVIFSCTRKGTSLERQTGSHTSIIFMVWALSLLHNLKSFTLFLFSNSTVTIQCFPHIHLWRAAIISTPCATYWFYVCGVSHPVQSLRQRSGE